ncbi:hypothetical protein MAPG_07200 [Magnaporthiopsis poae ATCC 64411]|uniref:Transposase Tc1-like domain-containing protein n=1 Tax=Magnaporthiopsis poae (strain ATCC 64411 / 73-15) TaxID=644358 RepID=A0A0C4E413_MAGP6|nr:hypothetical protein MAPG_07200 [Magnaporthiopsis poae ATCC 64411]
MPPHITATQKLRILAVCEFLNDHQLPCNHSDVFRWAGVSKGSGWRILAEHRTQPSLADHPNYPDRRGRKKIFTDDDIQKMKRAVEEHQREGRVLRWEQLPAAAGIDKRASHETVRMAMKKVGVTGSPSGLKKAPS